MSVHEYVCLDCGKEYTTGVYRRPSRRLCDQCWPKRIYDNARALHDHQGPEYDKWRRAIKAAARRL